MSILPRHSFHAPTLMIIPNESPFAPPDLLANVVMRVILGIIGTLACIVPFRVLFRNGEFAAVIFIGSVIVTNIEVVTFALIWHSDDMESWWAGYGLCDIHPYIYHPCRGLFVTCLLAIMRNLAHQVGLMRANPLSVKEKRRRLLIEALIIFPLPVIMMALTWPLTSQRYAVAGIKGCAWISYPSWPYIAFFMVAPIVVGLATTFYAVLTFIRFRQVSQTTMSVLSSNRAATLRGQRAKRRLYLMVISIIIPLLPVIITLAGLSIAHSIPLLPYSWNAVHHHQGGGDFFDFAPPWNTVIFVPSRYYASPLLNDSWATIVAALPIFVFFGLTKDAINEYRNGLLFVGCGRFWPSLHEEYDPDRKALQTGSFSASAQATPTIGWPMSRASQSTSQWTKSSSSGDSAGGSGLQSVSYLSATHLEEAHGHEDASTSTPSRKSSGQDAVLLKNPFPFRTRLNFTWPKAFSWPTSRRKETPDSWPLPPATRPSQQTLVASTTIPPLGMMESNIALAHTADDSDGQANTVAQLGANSSAHTDSHV